MKLQRIAAALTAAVLACCAVGCTDPDGNLPPEDERSSAAEKSPESSRIGQSGDENSDESSAAQGEDGEETLTISRSQRVKPVDMGEPDTWTVFVYLCGSDLETDAAAASADLYEMMDSAANDRIRFVVQTGGAKSWETNVDEKKTERYLIANGDGDCVYSGDLENMGESATLAEFLKWGIREYPAANMGLILWNHGSGSINGVCFDENFDYDALLLKELDAALYSVYEDMTEPFEFIGFDACLMASAETAAVLATHARYMIASEDLEPGTGWNYEKLGNYLAANPGCGGEEIGKAVCDAYYDDCVSCGMQDSATISVTDLSRMDVFLMAFDKYAEELYGIAERSGDYTNVARAISGVDNFGGNNRISGYTNMVDIGGMIEAGRDVTRSGSFALHALEDAVVYMRNGSAHGRAHGLSVYYPLQVQGSRELSIFKDICLSSYYLGLVDKIAYGAVHSGDLEDYQNDSVLDSFENDWGTDGFSGGSGEYQYDFSDDSQFQYSDDFEPGSGSSVHFVDAPSFDENGTYWFSLDEETLRNTDYVEAGVFLLTADEKEIIEIGYTSDIRADWEHGVFTDNFDGYWFSLPDEQLLSAILMEEGDGYDLYLSPVYVNGEETYLRFAWDYENGDVYIIDLWDGLDENGAAARGGRELQPGDEIIPRYRSYYLDSDDEDEYIGDSYIYQDGDMLTFSWLYDGTYCYHFIINDIYGNYFTTDTVKFEVDGESIYFSEFT